MRSPTGSVVFAALLAIAARPASAAPLRTTVLVPGGKATVRVSPNHLGANALQVDLAGISVVSLAAAVTMPSMRDMTPQHVALRQGARQSYAGTWQADMGGQWQLTLVGRPAGRAHAWTVRVPIQVPDTF